MFAFIYQAGGPTPSTLNALQQALSLPDVQQQRPQQFGPVVLIANLWREATDVRRLWTELVDGWLIAAWARLDQPQRLQRALGLPATTSDGAAGFSAIYSSSAFFTRSRKMSATVS